MLDLVSTGRIMTSRSDSQQKSGLLTSDIVNATDDKTNQSKSELVSTSQNLSEVVTKEMVRTGMHKSTPVAIDQN